MITFKGTITLNMFSFLLKYNVEIKSHIITYSIYILTLRNVTLLLHFDFILTKKIYSIVLFKKARLFHSDCNCNKKNFLAVHFVYV